MNTEDIDLTSVNWEFGMLLTPAHFLRQERYFEASLLWTLRYATSGFGLVGAGPRVEESERGAVRYDPIVSLEQDDTSVAISVSQCRALTPGGMIVEIKPDNLLTRQFTNQEMEAVQSAAIYIVCKPFTKSIVDGAGDEFNPQMKTARKPAYEIMLGVPADGAYAVCVGRLQRQRYGVAFQKDPVFIPPCTTMCSYSGLNAAHRQIVESVTALTDRYTELYRAMREYVVLFAERGIETESDAAAAHFVDRMLAMMQDSAFDLLDPIQAPQEFFGKLKRLFYRAAVYLDLTPAVQQYYDTLKQAGETEFIALLEQQRKTIAATRAWRINDDLSIEVRSAMGAIAALSRLEQALEGKYLDFRISPSLDAMNFVFDRGGKVLYRVAAKPARVQGVGDELNIYFSQLRLEGREKYRLILVGERNAVFQLSSRITTEIRINEGSGFRRQPLILSADVTSRDQCNFAFDFDAPDVPAITDVVVSLQADCAIRTALLFVRHRFYAQPPEAAPVEPLQPPRSRSSAADAGGQGFRGEQRSPAQTEPDRGVQAPWETPDAGGSEPAPPVVRRPRVAPPEEPPWEQVRRPEQKPGSSSPDDPPPPRRRRLE
jgi:hypothetical protein